MYAYKETTHMSTGRDTWHAEHAIETTATLEAIWRLFRDVAGWRAWNAGIERIDLEGPFAAGTWFTMKPPGQDELRSRLVEVRENEVFVDETRVGDIVVTVAHRLERLGERRTRVTYAIDVAGPEAAEVGAAVSSDFPDVLAALAKAVAA
jgi:hypothetical protein